MKTLTNSKTDISLLIARISMSIVMFAHGAQKLFGWFGGYGLDGTMDYFVGVAGLPYLVGILVIFGETAGALSLALGLFGRFMAGVTFIILVGAMLIDHSQHGFFMNWFGNQKGEGIEFDLLSFGLCLVIMLNGSGKFSVDALIDDRMKKYFPKRALSSL
jgi:putative oxidoreductase